MVNVLSVKHFLFLFSNKMLVFRAGIHKMLVRIANSQDCFFRIKLIWLSPFCLDLFGRQLVFKILERLLYEKELHCKCSKISIVLPVYLYTPFQMAYQLFEAHFLVFNRDTLHILMYSRSNSVIALPFENGVN